MFYSEHLSRADESYEIRFDLQGNVIHVFFTDGYAIVFPSLHDLFLRIYYGNEVERFYVDEETLNRMYDGNSYNYWDLKELYSQDNE